MTFGSVTFGQHPLGGYDAAQATSGAYTLSAATGTFTLTGQATALKAARNITADAGAYTLTGADSALRPGYSLVCGAGSYSLTGAVVALKAGRSLVGAAGAFTLTGGAVSLRKGFTLTAAAGSYSLSGAAVGLYRGSRLSALAGSFTVTGAATALKAGKRLVADSGAFVLTGANVLVNFGGRLEAGSGAFTLAGGDATFTVASGTTNLHGRRIKERRTRGKIIVFPDELPPEPETAIEASVAPQAPSGPLGIGEAVKALSERLAGLQAEIAQADAVARQRKRQQARIDALRAEIERVEIELQAAVEAERGWIARLRDDDEFFLLAA